MRGHVQSKLGADGKPVYYVVLELDRVDGKRKTKWLNVRKELGLPKPATKRQAEQLLVDKLKELQEGTYIEPSGMTVAEFLKKWVNDYGKGSWRQSTLDNYSTIIRLHINPEIGAIPLDKLRPLNLQQLYAVKMEGGRADKKKGGLSVRTVRLIHHIMNESLAMAVKWGLVSRNVAEATTQPKAAAKKREAWTPEEARAFLSSLSGHRMYPLYLLALSTGMRRGEIIGLRWQDIDLDNGSLAISQAVVAVNGKAIVSEPKTSSSRRTVALSAQVTETLRKHGESQKAELSALGAANEGFVFTSETGGRLDPRNLLRHFQKTASNAGLRVIPFHSLRHTSATMMLQAGIHPKVVAERLGHSRINITLDTYSHVLPDMQSQAASAMENALIGEGEKKERKRTFRMTKQKRRKA